MHPTSRTRLLLLVCAGVFAGVTVLAHAPQTPQKSATQFYTEYRAAFAKAKKIDELFPYMSAASLAEVNKTPAAERAKMFEFMKMMMGDMKDVKVVKETPNDTGATLAVEAVGPDKARMTGTVTILRENGAWKIGKESWKS